MSASNITMLLAKGQAHQSIGSMASIVTCLLSGSLELIFSIGVIAAYSHMLCYAIGLVLRDEQSLEHSNDPDLPRKEETAALMLTGFLGGIHIMLVFFGLSLFGHDSDSFLMKIIFSCAVLAAVTTGLIVGATILYLVIPAVISSGVSLINRMKGTSRVSDVEQAAVEEVKQPFIEKE